MQTQCPDCKTKFLVNDDELRVAFGKVRCSKCHKVFNALDSLQKPPPAKDTQTSDTKSDELPDTVTDFMSDDDLEEFADLKAKVIDDSKSEQNRETEKQPSPPAVEQEIDQDLSEVLEELERIESSPQDTAKPQEKTEQAQKSDAAQDTKTDEQEASTTPSSSEEKKIKAEEALEMLTPKKPPRKKGGLLWSIAILILIALALAQLAWFKREQLMLYPEGRMLLKTACEYAGCSLPTVRAPKKIQVLNRSIAVHPEIKNALLIQLTIANKASFTQPQPLLQISLYNNEEMLVAQRRFKPSEYLDKSSETDSLLPGKAIYVELVIDDPGSDVTGFKLDFF